MRYGLFKFETIDNMQTEWFKAIKPYGLVKL
ncbi:hypothetical protein OTSKARP_0102 [Orientia tsutsugamushi str. Karp]|nr:hypothetical protein OTSKARP_0102 [Orientia tsutsugamushi str. Karp]